MRNNLGGCAYLEMSVERACKEIQRKKKLGSLGAVLVACLSMDPITAGFNSKRWENHISKSWAAGVEGK